LFVGSEFACFVSIDGGRNWSRFMNDMPTVAFHDLIIHPRDHDLVAGTHGRSIWIADDITPLQQLNEEVLAKDVHLFENRTATKWQNVSLGRQQSFFKFRGENPPRGAAINFYLKSVPEETLRIQIEDITGQHKRELVVRGKAGINQARWDMRFPPQDDEVLAFKARLVSILEELETLVSAPDERDGVKELRSRLGQAETDRALNNIHRQLTRNFAYYSEGRDLFGQALSARDAAPGIYRVTLKMGGAIEIGKIRIRNDPILE